MGNQLTGSIPDLNNCPRLQKLSLCGNQLTGSIPDLKKCPDLQHLLLNGNDLTGTVPDLENCPELILCESKTIPDCAVVFRNVLYYNAVALSTAGASQFADPMGETRNGCLVRL